MFKSEGIFKTQGANKKYYFFKFCFYESRLSEFFINPRITPNPTSPVMKKCICRDYNAKALTYAISHHQQQRPEIWLEVFDTWENAKIYYAKYSAGQYCIIVPAFINQLKSCDEILITEEDIKKPLLYRLEQEIEIEYEAQ